jgi:hypothetical protein
LESLGRKHHIRNTRCIHKSTRVVLVRDAGVIKRGHGHVESRRRIILALENWLTLWITGVSGESPPISRVPCMFDRVEPHAVIRVIGLECAIGINSHTSPKNKGLDSRHVARPHNRGAMPKELPLRRMRGST